MDKVNVFHDDFNIVNNIDRVLVEYAKKKGVDVKYALPTLVNKHARCLNGSKQRLVAMLCFLYCAHDDGMLVLVPGRRPGFCECSSRLSIDNVLHP